MLNIKIMQLVQKLENLSIHGKYGKHVGICNFLSSGRYFIEPKLLEILGGHSVFIISVIYR